MRFASGLPDPKEVANSPNMCEPDSAIATAESWRHGHVTDVLILAPTGETRERKLRVSETS